MPVVERQANAVEAQALEERGVLVLEKVLKELSKQIVSQFSLGDRARSDCEPHFVEEEFRLFLPHDIREFGADLEFAARVSCSGSQSQYRDAVCEQDRLLTADEVLHATDRSIVSTTARLGNDVDEIVTPTSSSRPGPHRAG